MTFFQDYPFFYEHIYPPTCLFNYWSFIGIASRVGKFHISALWGLREMSKCIFNSHG